MAVPYTFANATSAIPLSQLDSNFATAVTIGNVAIQLGNTATTLSNLSLANVTITSSSISNVSVGSTANAVVYAPTTSTLATNANLKFDGTNLQVANSLSSANTFGFKNRIINGGMVIDQRNAGASVTNVSGSSVFGVDRWPAYSSQASKFTVQQNAGSVTPPSCFKNYIGVTSLSAYSVVAADEFTLSQSIEGFNVADLGFGAAGAATVTLSFWVRSSLTGSFGGNLANGALTRAYPFSYTISSTNTWEQKTITVAGDTTGTWLTTNGTGLLVRFGLGVGSTYGSGTAGAWSGTYSDVPTGSVSVVGTNGATFYITGVQLEVGSQATSFDFRDYGRELILCQRYYWKSIAAGGGQTRISMGLAFSTGNTSQHAVMYPVEMRATPTINSLSGNYIYNPVIGGATITSLSLDGASSSGTGLATAGSTGLIAQNSWSLFNATIQFSSEL